MKKILFYGVMLSLMCFVAGLAPLAMAQDQEEGLDYNWGDVVSVSAQKIVLEEYDYESDSTVQVSYTLDENVVLENVATLQDLNVGDAVEVGFVVDGEKAAKII